MRGSGWIQGFGWAAIAWLGVGCGGVVEREGSPDPVTSAVDAGDDAPRSDTDASIPTATRADASIPDAATYTDCVGTAGCTSTSTSCDACLQTDASAAAYGPIILGTGASDGFGEAFVNWGGCQSRLDGHTAAGSCGSETNAWQACANEFCPYATCAGGALEVCEDYAYETACVGHTESDACAAEWSRPGTGVPQCADLVTLATLWCGT